MDPAKRDVWEEAFQRHSSGAAPVGGKEEPHIFREISLEAFTPHYGPAPSSSSAAMVNDDSTTPGDEESTPTYWTYPCRCSRLFLVTHQDLEEGVDVIGCEGCGEWIRVAYEAVDEHEETLDPSSVNPLEGQEAEQGDK